MLRGKVQSVGMIGRDAGRTQTIAGLKTIVPLPVGCEAFMAPGNMPVAAAIRIVAVAISSDQMPCRNAGRCGDSRKGQGTNRALE